MPPSGIAVVRFSGAEAVAIAARFGVEDLVPRHATLRTIRSPRDRARLDRALCLAFEAPASATGEAVVEFHLHGGPALVDRVLADAVAAGARIAEPGEFTMRAVLNGRMGLDGAEALADLVEARTASELRRAARLADGVLARRLEDWRARLIGALALAEAHLDFADEADLGNVDPGLDVAVAALAQEFAAAITRSRDAGKLTDGYHIALVGAPNAGKSSLFNALVEREAALVSAEAGTTRDVVSATLDLGGYRVSLHDTAGLREGASGVEAMGIERSRQTMDRADLILEVVSPDTAPLAIAADARVAHKSDLMDDPHWCDGAIAQTSVADPASIARLAERLAERARDGLSGAEAALLTRSRQRAALAQASEGLDVALNVDALELKAEALRAAASALARLTGEIGIDDVLDDVFGRFCIGK